MKLNDRFLIHKAGEQTILVPTGAAPFSGVVQGNRTLGAILEQLKENTTEEKITAALGVRFDAPEEVIGKDVHKVLEELRKIGALDE